MRKSILVSLVLCGVAMSFHSGKSNAEEGGAPSPEVEAAVEKNLGLPLRDLEKAFEGQTPPESVRMLLAISRGSLMGAGDGWFGPGAGRYSWSWLAEKLAVAPDGAITREQFPGSDLWFSRLDRNKDGKIRGDDFDWSESNPWVQQSYIVNRMFRRIDPTGDGRLSRDEWQAFFDKASARKDHLLMDDLRDALIGGASGGFLPGDAPSQEVLIRGLFAGELGSLQEGPRVGDQAPDFALKTHDGSRLMRLGEIVGEKPVVITFGNFTCGPFRSMFPGVEDVHRRFAQEATFIAVYVREAHPTDGWKMESNARVGVTVAQPKTYDERKSVATQCHQLLKPAMPLLVDEINDPVGNAYSGMPARLYVIDRAGKVAYKGGRGPFGFKAGEMEQALVMTLLDGSKALEKETVANEQSAASRSGQ